MYRNEKAIKHLITLLKDIGFIPYFRGAVALPSRVMCLTCHQVLPLMLTHIGDYVKHNKAHDFAGESNLDEGYIYRSILTQALGFTLDDETTAITCSHCGETMHTAIHQMHHFVAHNCEQSLSPAQIAHRHITALLNRCGFYTDLSDPPWHSPVSVTCIDCDKRWLFSASEFDLDDFAQYAEKPCVSQYAVPLCDRVAMPQTFYNNLIEESLPDLAEKLDFSLSQTPYGLTALCNTCYALNTTESAAKNISWCITHAQGHYTEINPVTSPTCYTQSKEAGDMVAAALNDSPQATILTAAQITNLVAIQKEVEGLVPYLPVSLIIDGLTAVSVTSWANGVCMKLRFDLNAPKLTRSSLAGEFETISIDYYQNIAFNLAWQINGRLAKGDIDEK